MVTMQLKGRIPWWAKLSGKLVLSKIPVSYRTWAQIGIFRHGGMDSIAYAFKNFDRQFKPLAHRLPAGFSVLEMGPGDSLATALIARAHGATTTYLVDAGDFASKDTALYRSILAKLRESGLPIARMEAAVDLPGLMEASGCRYLTEGLSSLRAIPSASVDYVFSNSVLEHVLLHEFDATLSELRRILKPGAVASHLVDLKDHLGDSLHSLRFPERVWETAWFRNSGFYTNRLRRSEILARFARAGFQVERVRDLRWPKVPVDPSRLSPSFRQLPEDELNIAGFEVVLGAG